MLKNPTLAVCGYCDRVFTYARVTRRRVYCSVLCRSSAKGAGMRHARESSKGGLND